MTAEPGYLSGLSSEQARQLADANAPAIAAFRKHMLTNRAVAFLGAGASAPLYPMWAGLISELIDFSAQRGLRKEAADTCRARSTTEPDAVVEILRRRLGVEEFRDVLRSVLRIRRDPVTGHSWTITHELVCRCHFSGIVTTNYDPGIVDARMHVRPLASSTGFTSWSDELALDRWANGEVFTDDELPVLFAHGYHTRPDEIVLATTEYRRAYADRLGGALSSLIRYAHLVWIGFSFSDQRISAILREVAETTGTRASPGAGPRHIAVMPWDPSPTGISPEDPSMLRDLAQIQYGADLILYPVSGGDHSNLHRFLSASVGRHVPPAEVPAPSVMPAVPATAVTSDRVVSAEAVKSSQEIAVSWQPEPEPTAHFKGRAEELAHLSRWATDKTVRLIAVTAWAGAGKTSLVTHWLRQNAYGRELGFRGLFSWSFYGDPSAQHWVDRLLDWARSEFGYESNARKGARPAEIITPLLRTIPLLLVLDGLEIIQSGPAGQEFGKFIDGKLRDVLTASCSGAHKGLIVLTSRFPFADLERFDGNSARILDVPPLSSTEGSDLLAEYGGEWLPEAQREMLVASVDGHALAVSALGGCLADGPQEDDLSSFMAELATKVTTDARVMQVLSFYGDLLEPADRYLLAAVALFTYPVTADVVLAVAAHHSFGGHLTGWTARDVEARARARMVGLLSVHPDGSLSAHPLVRDAFRPLAMGASKTAVDITLAGVPAGSVSDRTQARRLVEAIELCLGASQWADADNLYQIRGSGGRVWQTLPAARLGQRAAMAFVGTPELRRKCARRLGHNRMSSYLGDVGMLAIFAGDLRTGREYLEEKIRADRRANDPASLARGLCDVAGCIGRLGNPLTALPLAREALVHAEHSGELVLMADSYAVLGWLAYQSGDTNRAEEYFITANRTEYHNEPKLPYSQVGLWWAEFLARTERTGPAERLTKVNLRQSRRLGHHDDAARCQVLLARLSQRGKADPGRVEEYLNSALTCFREGDYLYELADAKIVVADHYRRNGAIDRADTCLLEAGVIVDPRNLLPLRISVLINKAALCADRATTGSPGHIQHGRDYADAARRISATSAMAWLELDALQVHAYLDEVEDVDRGWRERKEALRERLIPAELDADPLATLA